jgi:hypothetical protein
MNPPTTKINNSIAKETVLTWNRPLYKLTPDPIAVTYKVLKDSAAAKKNATEVTRVSCTGEILEEKSGTAINNDNKVITSIA